MFRRQQRWRPEATEAVATTLPVLRGDDAVLQVRLLPPDAEGYCTFELRCLRTDDPADHSVVHFSHLLVQDPSLAEIPPLRPGDVLRRAHGASPWSKLHFRTEADHLLWAEGI